MHNLVLPLLATFLLSTIHFYFEEYAHHLEKRAMQFISFSSGLFITYIFLSMLPEMMNGLMFLGDNVYFIALWGFVIFHIIEKYVARHTINSRMRLKRLVVVRTTAFCSSSGSIRSPSDISQPSRYSSM